MARFQENSGFSLIEALIVVAIVGILLSLSIPSFRGIIVERHVETATQRMVSLLNRAVVEARSRYTMVTLRRDGDDWQSEVSMYSVDSGLAKKNQAANDRTLHVEDAVAGPVVVSNTERWVSFSVKGRPISPRPLIFDICADTGDGNKNSRRVELLLTGAVRTSSTSGVGAC